MKYPHYFQLENKDCGPTCLRMICKFYGKEFSECFMRKICFTKRTGTSLLGISDAAQELGFETQGVKIDINQLYSCHQWPCIVQWNKLHFVVVYDVNDKEVIVGDPAIGILKYPTEKFCKSWYSTKNHQGKDVGIALLFQPLSDFFHKKNEDFKKNENIKYKDLKRYLKPHGNLVLQLLASVLIGSAFSLIFPFLTQSIVDIGIRNQSIRFIVVILLCQLALSLGSAVNNFASSWLMLHISSRMSITLVYDFLGKLMRLPVSFFSKRMIGDLLQRINDFTRIENFLTTTIISVMMATLSFIIYGYVLLTYGMWFICIFLIGAALYIGWVSFFLKKRRKIDYMRFQEIASNESNVIHMINGMQEIKINNCEDIQLGKWQKIQMSLYRVNVQGLSIAQLQSVGGALIDNTKNILITFLSAWGVIHGDVTLGMMLAVQYLVGQLNVPLYQVISFMQSFQDANISMERINEININKGEDEINEGRKKDIPPNKDITISHVDFHYNGPRSPKVLDDISLTIRGGETTAIVGESGSGKSTLLKLILGFYEPTKGNITIGEHELQDFDLREWKRCCATVLQDGYLFSEPIKNNIGLIDKNPDIEKVKYSANQACIDEYIESLPLKYDTPIGADGNSVSVGQKQRILIARAIYKNAPYIFLDEATNSLDANNEKKIIENLNNFYYGKTVMIIAHRISTVVNADQIIVMSKGHIVEQGNHESLIKQKGYYYNLVKNQLNIGE